MAKFNPDVSPVAETKYSEASKGYDVARPSNAFEKLFDGVASLGSGVVKAVDDSNVNDIKKQAEAGVDQIRAGVGVDVATDAAAAGNTLVPNANGSPLPPAVSKAGDDAGRLRDAYNQGKISDSYYWGRVNALAKQIRTQYPGYRDQIDQTFSGITGANPANALRKAIQSDFDASQSALSSATNKIDQFEVSKAEYIGQSMPDYYDRKKAGNPYSFDEMKQKVGAVETSNQIRSQEMSKMDFLSKKGSLDGDTALGAATNQASQLVNESVGSVATALGAKINALVQSGKPIPEGDVTAVRAQFAQMKAKATMTLNNMLNKKFSDDNPNTFASTIKDQSKLEGIRKNALANLDTMEDMMINGQYGLFQANTAISKATTDYGTAQLLRNSDVARRFKVASDLAPNAINSLLLGRPELNDKLANAILLGNLGDDVSGQGSISKQLDKVIESKDPTTGKVAVGAASRLISDKATLITSKDSDDKTKVNVLKSMFDDPEGNFLTKFPNAGDRFKAFQRMTSPEITKEALRLKDQDPATFEKYRKWSVNSFSTLLKTEANSIADIAKFNKDIDIGFDPKSMQYAIKTDLKPIDSVGSAVGALDTGPVDLARKISLGNAQQSLNKINQSLANLKPILEGTGSDPNALAKVLTGINPQGEKEQGMIEWLGNGLLKAVNILQPVSAAKGDTPKANPKGDFQLDAYTPEQAKSGVADSMFSTPADLNGVSLDEVQSSVASGKAGKLLDAISKGESGGSYNKIYGGKEAPLTDMTIQQVMSLQNDMLRKGSTLR